MKCERRITSGFSPRIASSCDFLLFPMNFRYVYISIDIINYHMKGISIKDQLKVFFFQYPTAKKRVRQLERELNLPLPSVIRYLKELENEGLIKRELFSGITVFSADRASEKFIVQKRLFNVQFLFESGLVPFLRETYDNTPIVVYGSFARGEDIETSDIDIYIETPSKRTENLRKFEEKLNKEVHLLKSVNIRRLSNIELANNILNGIGVNGFLKVFKRGNHIGRNALISIMR